MAEYYESPQSKESRNREYKVCLNDRALRLLDHEFLQIYDVLQLWKIYHFYHTKYPLGGSIKSFVITEPSYQNLVFPLARGRVLRRPNLELQYQLI